MTTRQPRLYLRMEMTSSERDGVDWRSFSWPCLSFEAAFAWGRASPNVGKDGRHHHAWRP